MQRLEVSGVVRHIYASLGFKGLISYLSGGKTYQPALVHYNQFHPCIRYNIYLSLYLMCLQALRINHSNLAPHIKVNKVNNVLLN